MKLLRVTAAIVLASLPIPVFAAPEPSVGTLTSASKGTLVARDGKLLAARAGQSLFVGDKVITRGSSAIVAMPGCTVALAPTSILAIGSSGCAVPTSFAAAPESLTPGSHTSGSAASGATAYIVAALAVAAATGGVVAAIGTASSTSLSP